jgi:single-stranded-DNA-specific exonuclease
MTPIFRTNQVLDAGSKIVKEKHLKLMAYQNGKKFDGIGFNMSELFPLVSKNQAFDVCYSLEMNEFKGQKNLQLKIRDVKASV